MRIGVYGGTFDPIHFGHLLVAESCREQATLDQVWLMPAAIPPHKQTRRIASARQRIEMLDLALGGDSALSVCDLEINRGGVSYTAETLAEIQNQRPSDQLFFLMGDDSLRELHTWREPQRICELALPLIVQYRGAAPLDFTLIADFVSDERLQRIEQSVVTMPRIEIRSSDLRERVGDGRSIRFQTPRAVERYIATHGLYQ